MTTTIADALGVALGGLAQKRGLIPRLPAGDRLLADAAVWLTGEYADAVRSTHTRTLPDGETAMAVDLHPAVPPLVLTAADSGRVTVSSETGVGGAWLSPVRRSRPRAARHRDRHRLGRR